MADRTDIVEEGGRDQRRSDPSGYPVELESEMTTADGMHLTMRPIRPDDGPALTRFHSCLSSHSVYLRYFGAHPNLAQAEVHRFTHVDYELRMALVVEDGDQLVAVARYECAAGGSEAEVAFVVADDYQHHGLGSSLLDQLAWWAWRHGITSFAAETLAENRSMVRVFAESGFRVHTAMEDGTIRVHFPIEPDDAYRAALARRHVRLRPLHPTGPAVPVGPVDPGGSC